MDADQRVRDDARLDVLRSSARLLGEKRCKRDGVPLEDVLLAREERRALRDHPRDRAQLLERRRPVVPRPRREHTARREEEAREGVHDGRVRRALADRAEELLLERLEARVEEVLLRREVVEDGLLGDLRRARDLRDRHALEAPLGEELPRRGGDVLARLLLLPLAEAHFPML